MFGLLWCFVLPLFVSRRPTQCVGFHRSNIVLCNRVGNAFEESMVSLGFSEGVRASLRKTISEAGFEGTSEMVLLARDFVDRPEVYAGLLQSDFGFKPLVAHRIRAVVMHVLEQERSGQNLSNTKKNQSSSLKQSSIPIETDVGQTDQGSDPDLDAAGVESVDTEELRPGFKSVVVNERAKRRRGRSGEEKHEYGLPSNYAEVYPVMAAELDDFFLFMTRPSTISQETPVREATANVYMRHAKLFLGWCVARRENDNDNVDASLFAIVPTKEKESADVFLDFIMWLRSTRQISVSYEANLLRGLTKLLKFRFAKESTSDPSYGEKSFDDIPIIRELRKLHRDAHKRQAISPKSSDEGRKWLSWNEYLAVISSLRSAVEDQMHEFESRHQESPKRKGIASAKKKVATVYQYYLVLAFFASVPDRQRTIRELEIGNTFVKDGEQGLWTIKHGPDDYKTGKTYGDRPPLVLAPGLTAAIDDFIDRWRESLSPKSDYLFVQPRTGNPLTQDSVYQIVARNCYAYTGKKTNPHLLRDMIVTHVRGSEASEKQLEALALYMGHSIQMQRDSYDRRTLTKKVEPAVELLQAVSPLQMDEETGQE